MIKQLSTKLVYKNPWISVHEDEVEFPNGHKGIYGVVRQPDFALIIPFDGTHFWLVNQFRYPVKQESLEFPQGSHEQDPNVDPLILAHAELQEETGLQTKDIKEIGFFHEAPGYSSQGYHIFLTTDLSEGEKTLEVTEGDMENVKLSVSEFEQAVLDGTITDSPTIAAYGLLKIKKLI